RDVVAVVHICDRDCQLDLLEEPALDVEHQAILTRLKIAGELRDASVVIGLLQGDELLAAEEAYLHTRGRLAQLGVQNVCRDHEANLCAWTRWCRAISASSAV